MWAGVREHRAPSTDYVSSSVLGAPGWRFPGPCESMPGFTTGACLALQSWDRTPSVVRNRSHATTLAEWPSLSQAPQDVSETWAILRSFNYGWWTRAFTSESKAMEKSPPLFVYSHQTLSEDPNLVHFLNCTSVFTGSPAGEGSVPISFRALLFYGLTHSRFSLLFSASATPHLSNKDS